MSVRVTVGLPFYNNQYSLRDAILSVLNQSYENLELLLVNDGSTDDSLAVARSFNDPRVHIEDDGLNLGLAARLNRITDLTQTELLFRMDADDIMHPDRIEVQVARLQEADSPDLVSSAAWVIDGENKILGKFPAGFSTLNSSRDILLSRGFVIHPSVAGRTEWFRNNRYRDDLRRSEDWELWIRTFDQTNHIKLTTTLLYYRQAREVGVSNYRIAKDEQRRLLAQYGPSVVGHAATIRLQTRTLMQKCAVNAAELFGRSSLLMEGRYEKISAEERALAARGLAMALAELNPY